jgi:hypothetical protein
MSAAASWGQMFLYTVGTVMSASAPRPGPVPSGSSLKATAALAVKPGDDDSLRLALSSHFGLVLSRPAEDVTVGLTVMLSED